MVTPRILTNKAAMEILGLEKRLDLQLLLSALTKAIVKHLDIDQVCHHQPEAIVRVIEEAVAQYPAFKIDLNDPTHMDKCMIPLVRRLQNDRRRVKELFGPVLGQREVQTSRIQSPAPPPPPPPPPPRIEARPVNASLPRSKSPTPPPGPRRSSRMRSSPGRGSTTGVKTISVSRSSSLRPNTRHYLGSKPNRTITAAPMLQSRPARYYRSPITGRFASRSQEDSPVLKHSVPIPSSSPSTLQQASKHTSIEGTLSAIDHPKQGDLERFLLSRDYQSLLWLSPYFQTLGLDDRKMVEISQSDAQDVRRVVAKFQKAVASLGYRRMSGMEALLLETVLTECGRSMIDG